MNVTVVYIIFKILPALAALIYTAYLTFVIFSPARLRIKKDKLSKKYKNIPLFQDFHSKMYSKRTLLGWMLITFSLVLGVLFDYYRASQYANASVIAVSSLVLMAGLLVGVFLLPFSLNIVKNKNRHS